MEKMKEKMKDPTPLQESRDETPESTSSDEEVKIESQHESKTDVSRLKMKDMEKGLIIFEILVSFSLSTSMLLLSDELIIAKLGLEVNSTLFFNHVGYFIAVILNVGVGCMSDSLIGKLWISIIGVCFLIISCTLAVFITLDSLFIGSLLKLFFYGVHIFVCLSMMTYGVRTALILSEVGEGGVSRKELDFYIFLLWIGRTLVHIGAITGFFLSTWFDTVRFAFTCVGVISGLTAMVWLIFIRNKIQKEIMEKGIVFKCIKIVLKKKDSDANYNMSKKSLRIISVLTAIIGFGISYYVLFQVIVTECSVFDEDENYKAEIGAILVFNILEALMLLFLHFSFLSIFRRWKVELIDLRLHGIAYNFMGVAMILLCLGVSGLRFMKSTVEGHAQFRFYNGLNQTVKIKSDFTDEIMLEIGGLKVVNDVPCVGECAPQVLVELENDNFTSVLKGEELQSYTFIIESDNVRRISKRDPTEPVKEKAVFFVVTNVIKLNALIIFEEEYPVSIKPNLTDYAHFTVPVKSILKGYRIKSSLDIKKIQPIQVEEAIYSIFIHYTGNQSTLETDKLQLVLKSKLNPFLLVLPAIIGTFASALAKLSLYRFIIIESPLKLRGLLTSYLYMVLTVGVVSWVMCYTLHSIWIVALAIFTCVHILFNFCYSKFHANYLLCRRRETYMRQKLETKEEIKPKKK